MRTMMLSLAAAACLGLAVPAAAEMNRMSTGQSGPNLLSANMLDKAQYASSQKKKKGKKKEMTQRSSWGG